jgi:polyhydroxyalkanoate synthase subunit PhaC
MLMRDVCRDTESRPMSGPFDEFPTTYFAISDIVRRMQAHALGVLGLGYQESNYRVIAEGGHWRLRDYSGPGGAPPLLIVAAPIKRPYIWDLAPDVSAIRYCLGHGMHVYQLEWLPATNETSQTGLDDYVDAIAASVKTIAAASQGARPCLIGHSLGGTLAAIYCASQSDARGLVLLESPLCFEPASSGFRDALAKHTMSPAFAASAVPGSLLSQASAAASPKTFLWARWRDAALSCRDPAAVQIHARVERWTLDEAALPGKLVAQVLNWLYRENRFCEGTLTVHGKAVGPATLNAPTLAIVNTVDEVGPPASIKPFMERMATSDAKLIEYGGEIGVVLQHLGILVGRQAYAEFWPKIIDWIKSHSARAAAA